VVVQVYENYGWWASDGSSGELAKFREGPFSYTQGGGWRHPGEILNALGQAGWDLTGVSGSERSGTYKLFLKRQVA
jgi:hypothetical protein